MCVYVIINTEAASQIENNYIIAKKVTVANNNAHMQTLLLFTKGCGGFGRASWESVCLGP